MNGLQIQGLSKTYRGSGRRGPDVTALDGVDLDVPVGCFFTVLGPSGCGKSTLLRCIAGLEKPDVGRIAIEGRLLHDSLQGVNVPPNARGLGMVFQSFAVWPHMTVRQNVAFPLVACRRRARPSRAVVRERVDRALAAVQLDGLGSRRAVEISGGQQQRLALARALVTESPLLLLDEPLSNLDAPLRQQMRFELKRLQERIGVTTVYVTHDQSEALALSDLVAVMRNGRLEQLGLPRDVYRRPCSRFVADFIGGANIVEGRAERREPDGAWIVETAHGPLRAASGETIPAGTLVGVIIRPEQLRLTGWSGAANGSWQGSIVAPAFLGDCIDYSVRVGDLELRVRSDPGLALEPGAHVALVFPEEPLVFVPLA
ncbi:MAG: ABC transporter ATP-binding protein [Gaiellaceae bacterium]